MSQVMPVQPRFGVSLNPRWRSVISEYCNRSSVNYFAAFGGNNELYRLPNIDIEARLPYIGMEAKDSQHILKDCKKTGEVEIILFTL